MHRQFNYLYEFGPYRLDVQERRLTCDGQAVPLSPKLFDALLLLVEQHGRLLEKDELIKQLWPDSFVEESNLTHYISQLRKTLGSDAQGKSYIETVPKRGYRFVAAVRAESLVTNEVGGFTFMPAPTPTANGLRAETASATVRPPQDLPATVLAPDWNGWSKPAPEMPAASPVADAPVEPTPLATSAVWPWRALGIVGLVVGALLVWGGYRWIFRVPSASQAAAAFREMRPAKLTSNSFVVRAALAPDGKYMAYVLREGAQQSLWVKQTTATTSLPIIPAAAVQYRGLSFAPDGTQLYYQSYEQGNPQGNVYQVPTLGGTPRLVLKDVDSPVTFAPDGRQACFVRNYPAQRQTALIITNLDTGQERQLSVQQFPWQWTLDGPAWSPDGEWLAAVLSERSSGGNPRRLVALHVTDGELRTISANAWPWIGQLAWLPDQAGIAANAWHEAEPGYTDQLWLFGWPTGEAHLLINDLNSYAGVSVASAARALLTVQGTRFSRLWIVPRPTSSAAAPIGTAITTGFGDFYSEAFGLEWLPGNRLVYANNASGNTDIWACNSDGTQPKQLTRDRRVDMTVTSSADGRVLVYVSYHSGRPHLWRMASDGTNARQLTDGAGEFDPCLTADGRWVIYTMQPGEQPLLWKVATDGGTPEQLFPEPASHGRISPDGQWLACYLRDSLTQRQRVAVIPFARLAEGRAAARFFEQMPLPQWDLLRWTPDSQALTYVFAQAGVGNLWLQSLDSRAPQQLTAFKEDMIYRFAWSPDGQQLACERGSTVQEAVLLSASADRLR